MNALVICLSTFSAGIWALFNFAFTSCLNATMYKERPDIFAIILSLSIVTNITSALFFISFFRASSTSPGRIPDTPPWNLVAPVNEFKLAETKKSGGPRYCRYDRKYKPDRCHHCSQCQECTLRMDHHCMFSQRFVCMYVFLGPWLDNCIGFMNYKFFLLTLHYASLSMLLMAASCGWLAHYIFNYSSLMGIDVGRLTVGTIVCALCGVIACIVCLFMSIHVAMVLKGVTTLETFERNRITDSEDDSCIGTFCCSKKDPVTKEPIHPRSIYRQPTVFRNLKAALGDDVMWWWAPTLPYMKTGSSDGLTYETMQDTDRKALEDGADSPLMAVQHTD